MKITKTLYVKKRSEWRNWLRKNYKTEKEIWLVFYNKTSGKPRIFVVLSSIDFPQSR